MFNFIKRIFKKNKLGLLPLKKDGSEFEVGSLWGTQYQPKNRRVELPIISIKNQLYNTCQWNATAGAKEKDEGTTLDPRLLVVLGKKLGLISGDGFSNLKSGEIILQKYGCCEKGQLPDYENHNQSWSEYSNLNVENAFPNAEKHKSQSYWFINNRYEAFRALDEGHNIKFGITWKSSFNKLFAPFILNYLTGSSVGGHAIYSNGYDLDEGVFLCVNSFGESWGDKGKFKIKFEDFDREITKYGTTCNLDIAKNVGQWLIDNNGKNVKELNSSKVWFIEQNKKRGWPDDLTFKSYGFNFEDVITDEENILSQIEQGDDFNIYNSPKLQWFFEMFRLDKEGTLKQQFNKYFT